MDSGKREWSHVAAQFNHPATYFRVWKENRDRLVGFLGRSVIRTKKEDVLEKGEYRYGLSWLKNQRLLLTTGVFHHIYYSYVSEELGEQIRLLPLVCLITYYPRHCLKNFP